MITYSKICHRVLARCVCGSGAGVVCGGGRGGGKVCGGGGVGRWQCSEGGHVCGAWCGAGVCVCGGGGVKAGCGQCVAVVVCACVREPEKATVVLQAGR